MNCDETAGTSFLGWPEVLRHETSITRLPPIAQMSECRWLLISRLSSLSSLHADVFFWASRLLSLVTNLSYHKQQLSRKTQDRYGLTKGPSKVKGLNIYLGRIGGPEGVLHVMCVCSCVPGAWCVVIVNEEIRTDASWIRPGLGFTFISSSELRGQSQTSLSPLIEPGPSLLTLHTPYGHTIDTWHMAPTSWWPRLYWQCLNSFSVESYFLDDGLATGAGVHQESWAADGKWKQLDQIKTETQYW